MSFDRSSLPEILNQSVEDEKKELEEVFLLHCNAQMRCSSVLRDTKAAGFHLQKERHGRTEIDMRDIGRDGRELIHH